MPLHRGLPPPTAFDFVKELPGAKDTLERTKGRKHREAAAVQPILELLQVRLCLLIGKEDVFYPAGEPRLAVIAFLFDPTLDSEQRVFRQGYLSGLHTFGPLAAFTEHHE